MILLYGVAHQFSVSHSPVRRNWQTSWGTFGPSLIFPKTQATVNTMILEKIADNYLWFLVAILMVNLYQRKAAPRSYRKRSATLIIAVLAMVWQILIVVIISRGLPHWLAIPALALVVAIGIPLRKRILLFRTTCVRCSAKLPATAIINHDDNLCAACWADDHPEQHAVPEEQGDAAPSPSEARSVDEIDWDSWEPTETAVLCYLSTMTRCCSSTRRQDWARGW